MTFKLFVFAYILHFANSNNVISEQLFQFELEQNMSYYIRWMSNNLPFKNENGDKIKCVDLVLIHSKNNNTLKQRELIFLNKIVNGLTTFNEMTFCHRNESTKFKKINYIPCDILLFVDFNDDDKILFKNIRKYSLMNKSIKYFLVLLPYNIINFDKRNNHSNPLDWPSEIFIPVEVIVVVNFTIYHLQSPFIKGIRSLEIVSQGHYRKWKKIVLVSDFNGKHLRVLTLNCDTHNYWNYRFGVEEKVCKNQVNPPCVEPEGIESKVMAIVSDKMNFTWSMSGPSKGLFGFMQEDGTMDGIVGEVGSGMADFFYCGIWVLHYRSQLVDFSYSFLQRCTSYLVPRPTILAYSWYSIFLGFSIEIWISVVALMFLNFIFLILLKKISKQWESIIPATEPQRIIMDLIRIMTTGDSMPVYNISGYIPIISCWSFFCVFMVIFYNSDLVSYLTIPRYTPRIDTTDDFVNANLTWELQIQLPNFNFLNLNKKSDRTIKDRFVVETDKDTRIKNVLSGKYAVLAHIIDGHVVIIEGDNKTPVTNLRFMKQCVDSPYIAYGFPHNSAYKKSIETKLRIIFESGIIQYISAIEIRKDFTSVWDSTTKEADFKEDSNPEVLTVNHIYGAFIVLICGLIIAISIFCAEKLYEIIRYTKEDKIQ